MPKLADVDKEVNTLCRLYQLRVAFIVMDVSVEANTAQACLQGKGVLASSWVEFSPGLRDSGVFSALATEHRWDCL